MSAQSRSQISPIKTTSSSSTSDDEHEEVRTIFCANLDERVTVEILYEVFVQAGPIDTVRIPKETSGKQRPFGFVVYEHPIAAPYAMHLYQGLKLFRKPVSIKFKGSTMLPGMHFKNNMSENSPSSHSTTASGSGLGSGSGSVAGYKYVPPAILDEDINGRNSFRQSSSDVSATEPMVRRRREKSKQRHFRQCRKSNESPEFRNEVTKRGKRKERGNYNKRIGRSARNDQQERNQRCERKHYNGCKKSTEVNGRSEQNNPNQRHEPNERNQCSNANERKKRHEPKESTELNQCNKSSKSVVRNNRSDHTEHRDRNQCNNYEVNRPNEPNERSERKQCNNSNERNQSTDSNEHPGNYEHGDREALNARPNQTIGQGRAEHQGRSGQQRKNGSRHNSATVSISDNSNRNNGNSRGQRRDR